MSSKIFVLGLPRTGTTSICVSMLNLGYQVAHTAYTTPCFNAAEVVANVPIFSHFQEIDTQYPNARYIFLERNLDTWLPSIKGLLNRLHNNIVCETGGHHPLLKESYLRVFRPFNIDSINNLDHLRSCYERHETHVKHYFQDKRFLSIDVSKPQSYQHLLSFLDKSSVGRTATNTDFEHVNKKNKITYWKSLSHPNKISSTLGTNPKTDIIHSLPFSLTPNQ